MRSPTLEAEIFLFRPRMESGWRTSKDQIICLILNPLATTNPISGRIFDGPDPLNDTHYNKTVSAQQ